MPYDKLVRHVRRILPCIRCHLRLPGSLETVSRNRAAAICEAEASGSVSPALYPLTSLALFPGAQLSLDTSGGAWQVPRVSSGKDPKWSDHQAARAVYNSHLTFRRFACRLHAPFSFDPPRFSSNKRVTVRHEHQKLEEFRKAWMNHTLSYSRSSTTSNEQQCRLTLDVNTSTSSEEPCRETRSARSFSTHLLQIHHETPSRKVEKS